MRQIAPETRPNVVWRGTENANAFFKTSVLYLSDEDDVGHTLTLRNQDVAVVCSV